MQITSENILGYTVKNLDIKNSVSRIQTWIDTREKAKTFFCLNPHSIVEAAKDPLFKKALNAADLLTPDGAGILLASKILGGRIEERVTGSDIFRELNRLLNQTRGKHYSCFFLGSTDETLAAIRAKMAKEFPHIKFAGSYSPPYKPEFSIEDSLEMVEAVNRAKPDLLWVGMTAPKQEKWVYQHKDQLDVKFIGAVGAVFDFYIGKVKRSHPVFQNLGLEWLPRLLQEPKRLFRRNFVSSPVFLYRVLLQKYEKRG